MFEFSDEETPEIIEEFYPVAIDDDNAVNDDNKQPAATNLKPSLKDKLDRKAAIAN